VQKAELEGNGDLSRALELTKALGSAADSNKFVQYGPTTCPLARRIANDPDFQVTQISDCVVISAEVSPAGMINLVSHCFGIALRILTKGALCRGVITRGKIWHRDGQFIGRGYMRAFQSEPGVAFMRADENETGTVWI
jgi:hypothetical protein